MSRLLFCTALPIVLALSACNSSIQASPDASGDASIVMDMDTGARDVQAVDTPGVDVVPHTYTATIGPVHLAVGEEQTYCVIRRLGNVSANYLRRIHSSITAGSHHLIFYRAAETTEQPDPFPCTGFSGIQSITQIDSPMIIAQQLEAELNMPEGVGMNLAANQMVRIELHAINITTAPISVTGTVTLDTVEQTSYVVPADVMFWGPWGFSLPAHEMSHQDFFHRPMSSAHIFALTSHTHRTGTLATISLATNATDDPSQAVDTTMLHRSTNWSDPPLTVFDPPLRMPDSTTGLHLRCNYNNTTSSAIHFGESFNDEMCFMWAYYYPAVSPQVCASGLPYDDGGVVCVPP